MFCEIIIVLAIIFSALSAAYLLPALRRLLSRECFQAQFFEEQNGRPKDGKYPPCFTDSVWATDLYDAVELKEASVQAQYVLDVMSMVLCLTKDVAAANMQSPQQIQNLEEAILRKFLLVQQFSRQRANAISRKNKYVHDVLYQVNIDIADSLQRKLLYFCLAVYVFFKQFDYQTLDQRDASGELK